MKSILLVIHPGYAVNRKMVSQRYGDYGAYLTRLKDAVSSQDSIVFVYGKDKIPFELPSKATRLVDRHMGCYTDELESVLKRRHVERVNICGEFLWQYKGDPNKNLKRFARKLSPGKRAEFEDKLMRAHVLDAYRFAKEMGFNQYDFAREIFDGNEPLPASVIAARDELKGKFSVRIVRRLCYPTVDP